MTWWEGVLVVYVAIGVFALSDADGEPLFWILMIPPWAMVLGLRFWLVRAASSPSWALGGLTFFWLLFGALWTLTWGPIAGLPQLAAQTQLLTWTPVAGLTQAIPWDQALGLLGVALIAAGLFLLWLAVALCTLLVLRPYQGSMTHQRRQLSAISARTRKQVTHTTNAYLDATESYLTRRR